MGKDQYTVGHTSRFDPADLQGDVMVHYLAINGTITMAELMGELARQDAPDELTLTNTRIEWKSPATIDALEERAANQQRAIERRAAWEQQTLRDLAAKYPDALKEIEA